MTQRLAFRLPARLGRGAAFAGAVAVAWAAHAQPIPYGELGQPDTPAAPLSYSQLPPSGSPLGAALRAARVGDAAQAELLAQALAEPAARHLVLWALVDGGARVPYETAERARRELAGWPRPARRLAAVERALDGSGQSPSAVLAFFAGRSPETAEGAMALASALDAQGRRTEAQALVRSWWRDRIFEADVQARMLARFGLGLTQEDHARRLDVLLYGQQGPACRALLDMVDAEHRTLAEARMAFRADRGDASSVADVVAPALQADGGLAYERARYYRKRGMDGMAVAALKGSVPPTNEAGLAAWPERRTIMRAALNAGDAQGAYSAAAGNGMTGGGEAYSEAEFFAGWIALVRLRDPQRAEAHFAHIQTFGVSPVTLSRALYWRGRAAEAAGDAASAQDWFAKGGAYTTAFYGQLAAQRAGVTQLVLASDPQPTSAQRNAFEAREPVRAARLLAEAGDRDAFRGFVLALDDELAEPADLAALHDLAKGYGDQDLAMRVARAAGQKGSPLVERGWPVISLPNTPGAAETAFSLAIARQESNFDPRARSAFAKGLMQLRPSTGAIVARKLGLGYSEERLYEPVFNLTLGSTFLGGLVDTFGGSYVMAAAGYNAGPGRPAKWAGDCGDPRGGGTDPADFIECIPFAETRNYVMRVMENVQIYRARLAGGTAPLTLAADLKRGSWTAGALAGVNPSAGPIPYSELNTTR